ncbi:Apoptosis inhibitor 5 [Cichlidogyrus casuarinus]|uniref:Apoptosis inhibitor 5 n=1 Tax=Cichlidogyrus casuarinus TaxID=1844966 RepID=A0ABD2Q8E9_9PLAT
MVSSVDQLYTLYEELNDQSLDEAKRIKAYRTLVEGKYNDSNSKRLRCQFIAKFFKNFESMQEEAFEKLLDLCEDELPEARKQAVHDLQTICKSVASYIPKVAAVFTQMMQTEDAKELSIVTLSLSTLLHEDVKSTLDGLFKQLSEDDNPDAPRGNIFKFLHEKLRNLNEAQFTTEMEEIVVENVKKLLLDCGEDEFHQLIAVLSSLRSMSTVPGRQKLISMISDQALLSVPVFVPTDPAAVAQIRESCKQITIFVSKNVHAEKMVSYLMDQVLPEIARVDSQEQLGLLQVVAQLIAHGGPKWSITSSNLVETRLASSHKLLMDSLPEIAEELLSSEMDMENLKKKLTLDYKFSELECILYIVHHLAALHPQFYGGYNEESEKSSAEVTSGEARLKALRPRIQFLFRVCQVYAQQIAERLKQKVESDLSEDELKIVSHKLMSNIQTLGRSFFKNPPTFKQCLVTQLSWQAVNKNHAVSPLIVNEHPAPTLVTASGIALTPITFDSDGNSASTVAAGQKRNRQHNAIWAQKFVIYLSCYCP